MTLLSGEVLLNKDTKTIDENGLTYGVSYAAQTPWLQQQSIKDNIIFGYPFDEARYKDVLECCALNPDLKVLEDGDRTEIGARGVSLSGGQKARSVMILPPSYLTDDCRKALHWLARCTRVQNTYCLMTR